VVPPSGAPGALGGAARGPKFAPGLPAGMADDADDVVAHLRSHAGDALQAVVVYDEESHRDLYRRDDVADLHGSGLEAAVVEDVRADRRARGGRLAEHHEGVHRATTYVFDERAVLHLPRDDRSGTVVVLDVSAASDLAAFVRDVRADLYGE